MKLTEKQKKFVDYYLETGNAEESAKRAGYSARGNTTKLLQNTTILSYLDKRHKEIADKRIMKAQEALELLTSIGRGEMTEELYIPTETGIERIEKKPDIKDRHKAIESILKRYPMNKHDELKDQLMQAQINKTNAEIEKLSNNDTDTTSEVANALRSLADGINQKAE